MKRLQKVDRAFKGEITAFLSLIFILMLSVVGALIESASIQITRSRKRADVGFALESVFAEYDKQILEAYDLFARHEISRGWIGTRLEYYGASGMTHQVVKAEYLSDHQGMPYYEQAVRYMKHLVGVEGTVEGASFDAGMDSTWEQEERTLSSQLDSLLAEEESVLPDKDNPFRWLDNMKNTGLLTLVAPDVSALSQRSVIIENLASGRTLQEGNYGTPNAGGVTERLLFNAYLTEHFADFSEANTEKTLVYEQEYLIGGQAADKDNLEAACRKILNIRMAINYMYLLTDASKQAEAGALAAGICSLFASPYIAEVVKHALLISWAYGESIVDVRVLLKGKKVAVVKTAQNWQLQISNLTKLGTSEEVVNENESVSGLSYQDYLKGLLLVENTEILCMRSLDLIESNMHMKADEYMTKVEIESNLKLRRGIEDTFWTSFAYQ